MFANRIGAPLTQSEVVFARAALVSMAFDGEGDLRILAEILRLHLQTARILGIDGRAGTLAQGAAGDLVVWDGDPLEVGSTPVRVFIDGVEQPLENHQSRLRDRYRDLDTSDLPKGYDW